MKIIGKNTEERLIADLKDQWMESKSSRCAQLKFSQFNVSREIWETVLLNEIKAHLTDDVDTIYFCHDNDIFITSKTFTQKKLNVFLTHLKHKLSSASLQGLASLFEVNAEWPRLRTILERKIEDISILQNKTPITKKEQFEKANHQQTLNTINRDLLNTLDSRRKARQKSLIMVVEDDPFTQKLIKNTIKSTHDLSIVNDGQGAIMSYVNKAPDILFLDIGLPDIDGLKVLKKIFQIDPNAYVVMFSGNGDKENIMKAIELGAKGFVGKPFTKDKIHQYIEKSPFIQNKCKQGVM